MTEETKTSITLTDAQQAINQDRQQRSDACNQAIAQILSEYRCQIQTPIQVVDGRLVAQPLVVAL